MKLVYSGYTKEINNVKYYFVKKYITFPELENSPKIVDSMGMHVDFLRACKIAAITEEEVVHQLMKELKILPEQQTTIHVSGIRSMTHSLIKNTQHAILKFRFAGFN